MTTTASVLSPRRLAKGPLTIILSIVLVVFVTLALTVPFAPRAPPAKNARLTTYSGPTVAQSCYHSYTVGTPASCGSYTIAAPATLAVYVNGFNDEVSTTCYAVSDSKGDSFALVAANIYSAADWMLFTAQNATATTGGSATLTMTNSIPCGSGGTGYFVVVAVDGATGRLDNATPGWSATQTVTLTTAHANDLILGFGVALSPTAAYTSTANTHATDLQCGNLNGVGSTCGSGSYLDVAWEDQAPGNAGNYPEIWAPSGAGSPSTTAVALYSSVAPPSPGGGGGLGPGPCQPSTCTVGTQTNSTTTTLLGVPFVWWAAGFLAAAATFLVLGLLFYRPLLVGALLATILVIHFVLVSGAVP